MIYAFGAGVLNTQLHVLSYAGQPVNLRPKAFDVLVYLMEHRHRVVTRQELREQVWPNQFISDATLGHGKGAGCPPARLDELESIETELQTIRSACKASGRATAQDVMREMELRHQALQLST